MPIIKTPNSGSTLKYTALAAALMAMSAVFPATQAAELEEIVVTAQKRSESINDVPIAISALGTDEVQAFGITDIYDLRGAIPGLEVRRATGIGNPTLTIRGVGATNFDTISGSVVATYIDDIAQVSSGQLNFTSFDLGGIEVLKGPQGTLFGAGTTAGVVQYRTAAPTQEFEAYAKTEAGDFGTFALEGAISGALSETVAGRFSARAESFDGYYFNNATNDDAGGNEAIQLRGQLLFESDLAKVLVGARYSRSQSEAILYQLVPVLEPDNGSGIASTCSVVQAAIDRGRFTENDARLANSQCVDIFGFSNTGNNVDDPYTSTSRNFFDDDAEINLETFGFNVRADLEIGNTTFTSITGVDRTEHGGIDPEGPLEFAGVSDVPWITDVLAFSQELRLSGGLDSNPWVVGMNISANEIENDQTARLFFPGFGGAGSPFVDPNITQAEVTAGSVDYSAPQDQDTIEAGIFAQKEWSLSDSLTAVTGIRGGYYEKIGTVEAVGFFDPVTTELEETNLSFNLGLNYEFGNTLAYAKISQGVRAGSHAGGFIFSPEEAPGANQETLLSYEAGVKTLLLDDSLQLNASAFFYDYQDLQSLTQRLVGTTFVQTYTNIGDAEVKGLEVEATWAATEALLFKVSSTFLDSEVVRSDDRLRIDFTGNELANSPDAAVSLLARYSAPVTTQGHLLELQYNSNYTGDQFRNVDNAALDFDESTFKHNVNVTLRHPEDRWEVSAFVRNLTDELDFTWQFTFGGAQRRSFLAPRTYGISATYRW